MIEMYCDSCGCLVDADVHGAVRLKMGRKEFTFHLCGACQDDFEKHLQELVTKGHLSVKSAA